jgi:ribosome modulation factor
MNLPHHRWLDGWRQEGSPAWFPPVASSLQICSFQSLTTPVTNVGGQRNTTIIILSRDNFKWELFYPQNFKWELFYLITNLVVHLKLYCVQYAYGFMIRTMT